MGREDTGEFALDPPGAEEVGVVPWPLLLRRWMAQRVAASDRGRWIVLSASLFGLFTVGFTITILAVSLPRIARDLETTPATLTWVITGPLLALGVVGPAFGRLGDLWGQRRVYLLGLGAAGVLAGATALAPSAAALIAFRVLGAVGGAATGPAAMAMIAGVFPPERRVQALGLWSLVMAGSPVLGVVAGGPVVEAFGWRWIFVGQVVFTVIAWAVAYAILPESRRAGGPRSFDWVGALLLAAGVTSLLVGLNRGPEWGWASTGVVAAFAAVPVALAAFVVVEQSSASPLVPLRYLRRRNVAVPMAAGALTQFAYMGGFILTPLLLQDVLGYGETRTGLLSIARPLTFAIAGPVAGWMAVRVGERASAVFGAAVVSLSMVALSTVAPGSSDLTIVVALALSGLGLGATAPALSASVANAVDDGDLGVAGASYQLAAQVGVVAGIQIMQTVQATTVSSAGLVGSYGDAFLTGAAACAIGAVAASFLRSTPRGAAGEEPAPAGDRGLEVARAS
jgi:EmrB/QacA subfamily drug resistance transporter